MNRENHLTAKGAKLSFISEVPTRSGSAKGKIMTTEEKYAAWNQTISHLSPEEKRATLVLAKLLAETLEQLEPSIAAQLGYPATIRAVEAAIAILAQNVLFQELDRATAKQGAAPASAPKVREKDD